MFPKECTSSVISVGFGEALLRLLESLTDPLIPTSLNVACGQATSKDEGFEVSLSPRRRSPIRMGTSAVAHHSAILVAYANHWRRTAARQVSTCFRQRTSGLFPYLAI